MPAPLRSMRSERGAVLVHVAIAAVGLVAFSSIAIDYGILWMSRGQAQNAADAAAMAGAISLAFDDPNDYDRARQSAKLTGEQNKIFSVAPNITQGSGSGGTAADDISFPTCPPPGLPDTCVRVNVYRNQHKDALPTFFARLLGVTSQGVKATATAKVVSGNTTECLKPWAVADRWDENVMQDCGGSTPPCSHPNWVPNNTWDRNQTFDRFAKTGNVWGVDPTITQAGQTPDAYIPPAVDANGMPIAGTGSGFGLYNPDGSLKDYGQLLAMHFSGGSNVVSSGWFMALDLPCVLPGCPQNSGASKYEYNIKYCSGVAKTIGDTIPVQTGVSTGPTSQGTYNATGQLNDSLFERDPNAYWDTATQSIKNSCAPGICADGRYYADSPRVVPVALFDVQQYLSNNPTGSGGSVTITNIFGFFILGLQQAQTLGLSTGQGNTGDEVYGVMVAVPGLGFGNPNQVTSSFLNQVILVR